MITASIYGRLGADPVERTTRNGNAMTTANLAVNAARAGEDEQTVWFSIAAFARAGEALARHAKGDLLAAMGPLHRTRFTGRDGVEREGWSLTADVIVSARTVRPGGGKRRSDDRDTAAQRQPELAGAAGPEPPFNDDLPF